MQIYKIITSKKAIGLFVMVLGIMLLLYPLFTNVYSYMIQKSLRTHMENLQFKDFNAEKAEANDADAMVIETAEHQNFTQALLEIPSIKLSTVVLPGTSADTLKISPGWYEQSALPGKGNTAIAGHRTMYGEWFHNLSRLTQGEIIILKYEECSYKYQVESVFKVKNDDWSAIKPCGYLALTLTTCVKGDSGHRLVVRAKMLAPSQQ